MERPRERDTGRGYKEREREKTAGERQDDREQKEGGIVCLG